ncbi:hypothetical protein BSKO_00545 [Bryopsis sp. KO-2023]|nr:hypothetical protein BSKO_00545 [Bryopsis sp. KO-2023]
MAAPTCSFPRTLPNVQLGRMQTRSRRGRIPTVCCASDPKNPIRDAAIFAVDTFVESGDIVGLGTGEMSKHVFEYIREQLDSSSLKDVKCMPTSDAAATEAAYHGLPQTAIGSEDKVDVVFQEVDVMDPSDCSFVSGWAKENQQPQIMRARLVLNKADECVALVDSQSKVVERLGGSIPVVIEGETWEDTAEEIDTIFLGDAEIWRRGNDPECNPRGEPSPYISQEGHNVIDVRFYEPFKLYGEKCSYEKISNEIMAVEGVVTHGLVLDKITAAVVASDEGPLIIKPEVAKSEAVASDE